MWIDVNDRKPEDQEFVLCTNANMPIRSVYDCYYRKESELFVMLGLGRDFKVPVVVTHWMLDPLMMMKDYNEDKDE